MKKRILCITLVFILVSMSLLGCSSSSNGNNSTPTEETKSELVTLKFALTVPSTHPYSIASQNFAKLVEEKSNGSMKIELYYDGALGGDADLLEAMQLNAVQFALMGPAGVESLNRMYNFFDLPGLFANKDAAYAFQEAEPVKNLLASLASSGIRGLGFYENGYYGISNNKKPITKVADLNKMSMRSMTSDIAIESWKCLNVQPVSMPFGELFLALQQGVVDGQETTIGSFYSSKFYEVQKHLTMSNRIFHVMTFLMSNQAWDALSDDQQNIIMESVEESKKGHKEYMVTFNNDAIQDMVSNYGLIFTESLDDGEFEKMREMSQPIYDMVRKLDPNIFDELMKAADETNAQYK